MKRLFLFVFFISFAVLTSYGQRDVENPLVWNVVKLDSARQNPTYFKFVKGLLNECDSICKEVPVAITDKKKTFAPNPHYYCSLGTYWWPDSTTKGKYVNRDGYKNPENSEYDSNGMG